MAQSNQEIGDANHANLVAFLDRVGPNVPLRPSGDIDVAAIVREAPLTARRVIYDNERNRGILNAHLRRHGLHEIGAKPKTAPAPAATTYDRPGAAGRSEEETALRRRLGEVERHLAASRGEVVELRRRMRRYEAIEIHLADTGRMPR